MLIHKKMRQGGMLLAVFHYQKVARKWEEGRQISAGPKYYEKNLSIDIVSTHRRSLALAWLFTLSCSLHFELYGTKMSKT